MDGIKIIFSVPVMDPISYTKNLYCNALHIDIYYTDILKEFAPRPKNIEV